MPTPRYVPRNHLNLPERDKFGRFKVRPQDWMPAVRPDGTPVEHPDKIAASIIQHRVAMWMRAAMQDKGIDHHGYGRYLFDDNQKSDEPSAEQHADRVRRYLRGETVMKLTDIAAAERHLGLRLTIGPPITHMPDNDYGDGMEADDGSDEAA